MDLEQLAEEWARAHGQAGHLNGNGVVNGNGNGNGQTAPPPMAQMPGIPMPQMPPPPPPPQMQQQQPQAQDAWRETPDGSLLGAGFSLDWLGAPGDYNSPVALRDQHGQIFFHGYFGELAQTVVPSVWIPVAARTGQLQAQQQGLAQMPAAPAAAPAAPPAPPVDSGMKTRRTIAGVGLTVVALTAGAVAAWKAFGSSGDSE